MSTSVQSGALHYFEDSPLSFSSEYEPPALSPMNEPTKWSQKSQQKYSKYKCKVCGDEASGFHYGVMTCNGCGSFFRRSILSGRHFVCARGGLCSLSKDVRCACRACRLTKCKAVGMCSDFPSNSLRNRDWNTEQMKEEPYNLPLTPPIVGLHTEQMKQLDFWVQEELGLLSFRDSSINMPCPDYALQYLLGVYPPIQGNIPLVPLWPERNSAPLMFWSVVDLFLTVEFAKSFQEFRDFTISDQIKLLCKTAGVIQLLTQSFYSYQKNSDFLIFPDGSIPLHSSKEKRCQEFYCRSIDICRRLNMNLADFVLLKTLLLFTDDVEFSPFARELIQNKRERLTSLFSMYMFSHFGPSEGPQKMADFLLSLSSLMNINESRQNSWYCLHITNTEIYSQLIHDLFFTKFVYLNEFEESQLSMCTKIHC